MQALIAQLQQQRHFFESGATRPYAFRKQQLLNLKRAVEEHEEAIYAALYADLHKSKEECWVTENGFFMAELKDTLANLKSWMEPEAVPTNLLNLPSSSKVMREPLGVVLIIGPWNYPFQLLFTPLMGALAAGNTVVLKPSEFAPATAAVMEKIIHAVFPPEQVLYVPGDGATVIPAMMNHFAFDHVFYTGSTGVGKIIYKMAAENLVPVTLELGGKSPCVVEEDANITIAAKRIAMPKFSNAGQMCVAPDYVLVHESKRVELIEALKKAIPQFYGNDAAKEEGYGRIINEKQFNRIIQYLSDGTIVYGGKYDAASLYIEPTILDGVSVDSTIMRDEIFGPILPILSFNTMEEAKAIIAKNPNPLAFYIFTGSSAKEQAWLQAVPAGGACVNTATLHLTNPNLPFGGRGFSGTGAYHGKYSFETFSHKKAVMKTPTWFDPALKYPPFTGKLKLLKWLVG
ncbi:MAG TPA: aldehyde dehydrogenase [Sediminibacterium sp.]|uniref:aldehyde dehydrogenase n=1 Tax=Sediminibacterium sp. TaxID=1917865 RepID=UPI0008C234B7|nr:aldehyde dehydrogenase [Sediminibacterium sp.]OHC86524.1 MAG: aldehyde dehydrogenase [Sphingobacteriia bacterium RIFOXYC2_FULL_35_18]OHC88659.1 MAG: aldehyde dehydrogenase [Sphingobacteriia bacterium RIFOXYD2_FULL_35_12]HLD54042.1 aldehyde dehydrogenase [Sediminibacterium sp.]